MLNTQTDKAGERTQKFDVGDHVDMVNDADLRFPGKTVVGIENNPIRGFCYYITPTDTPWFTVEESHLHPVTSKPRFDIVKAGDVLKDGDEYQDPNDLHWYPTKSAGRKVGIPNFTSAVYRRTAE